MNKLDYNKVRDSGKRQHFNTGSVRDTNIGKGRYDLLPFYAISRLAKHYENGAVKYGDRNWELGQPLGRYIDSCIRHISKWMEGFREEDHLAAAVWNLLAIIDTERKILSGALPISLLSGLPEEVLKTYDIKIKGKTYKKQRK